MIDPNECARLRSVSPWQCYSHEDMVDAESRSYERGYLSALWDVASGDDLWLLGVTVSDPGNKEIVLSQRNLLALLHKLDMPGSARTIVKPCGTVVRCESNEEHYGERSIPAGEMHPDTEEFISGYE